MTLSKAEPNYHEIFQSLPWVLPLISSPEWIRSERKRPINSKGDIYIRQTMQCNNAMLHQLELYRKPVAPSQLVEETVSLFDFGPGLTGFPSIIHGGALATIMDEALGFVQMAQDAHTTGVGWAEGRDAWENPAGVNIQDLLQGLHVTSKLDIKFLKPVMCPGVVGVETKVLSNDGRKVVLRGVMKDGEGRALASADGIWVRIGKAAKI